MGARMLCCVSQSHVYPAVRGMAAALAGIPGVLSELAPWGANHSKDNKEHMLHVHHSLPDTMVTSSCWGLGYSGFSKFWAAVTPTLPLTAGQIHCRATSLWQPQTSEIHFQFLFSSFTSVLLETWAWGKYAPSWTGYVGIPFYYILPGMKGPEQRWWFLSQCWHVCNHYTVLQNSSFQATAWTECSVQWQCWLSIVFCSSLRCASAIGVQLCCDLDERDNLYLSIYAYWFLPDQLCELIKSKTAQTVRSTQLAGR